MKHDSIMHATPLKHLNRCFALSETTIDMALQVIIRWFSGSIFNQ